MRATDKTVNFKMACYAGLVLSLVQILAGSLLIFVITNPVMLAAQVTGKDFSIFYFVLLFAIFLVNIGLALAILSKKLFFVYVLLGEIVVWLGASIWGIFFIQITENLARDNSWAFWMTHLVYFGVLLIILFWFTISVWGQPSRKYRRAILISTAVVLIIAPILASGGKAVFNSSGSIAGHIYKPDGTLVDYEVQLSFMGGHNVNPRFANKVIDTRGDFKIVGLSGSDNYQLWVIDRSHNLYSAGVQKTKVRSFRQTTIDFQLVPGGSISGRFLDNRGNVLPDGGGYTKVELFALINRFSIPVNPDGTYSLTGIPPNEYTISVYTPNILTQTKNPVKDERIIIKGGKETIHDFTITEKNPSTSSK